MLKELHQLSVEELGKAVAEPAAIGADMGEEFFEGRRVGEVAAAFAGDAQFAAGLVHFFQKDHFGSLLGGHYGGHHTGRACSDDYNASHQVLER